MRNKPLGRTGLFVSELCLGTMTFGGSTGMWAQIGQLQQAEAERLIGQSVDAGINFIDTANVYGRGAAETFLGEALRGVPRDRYVLATKAYFPMSELDQGLSAAQIAKQLDASLARLRVDHVDLYQCHRYDGATPLEETMAALDAAVRQGKVRWLGFSEWTPAQVRAALALPFTRFVSSQPQYSLLWRGPEAELFPLCAAEGIGQIVWSPLRQGILTGKYRPGAAAPSDSRAASPAMNAFLGEKLDDAVLARVQRLQPIAAELGLTTPQLALAWVLRRPEVTSAIIGASRPAQVLENAAASGVALDPATVARVEAALAG